MSVQPCNCGLAGLHALPHQGVCTMLTARCRPPPSTPPPPPPGVYAMIDDGELDWKVICIRADDPLAAKLNDVEDVER